ncbi:MAG: hypothetical protein HRU19_27330 [Pseudobacteriovorax sp.]|nr:hypothetical protein [Pseudobacteriovorax sp.]
MSPSTISVSSLHQTNPQALSLKKQVWDRVPATFIQQESFDSAWSDIGCEQKGIVDRSLKSATFRLKIVDAKPGQPLVFFSATSLQSLRLFVGKNLVGELGAWDHETGQLLKPTRGNTHIYFVAPERSFELILQLGSISNIYVDIPRVFLKEGRSANKERDWKIFQKSAVTGSVLFISMYHFIIFLFLRRKTENLYFGFFCLFVAIRLMCRYDFRVMFELMPFIDLNNQYRIEVFCVYLITMFLYLFFGKIFPREFKPSLIKNIILVSIGFLLPSIFYQYPMLSSINHLYLLLIVTAIGPIGIWNLIKATIKGRLGAKYVLTGATVYITSVLVETAALLLKITLPSFSTFTILIFFGSQSLYLSYSFMMAYISLKRSEEKNSELITEVNQLNTELSQKNNELESINKNLESIVDDRTQEIKSIMTHVPIGIMLIKNDNLLIEKPYSDDVSNLFDSQALKSETLPGIFASKFLMTTQEIDSLKMVLSSSIGSDEINFDANIGHLPQELKTKENRYYRLTWSSVADQSHTIKRILLTIDDISLVKSTEADLAKAESEMNLVAELLNCKESSLLSFFKSLEDYLESDKSLFHRKSLENISAIYANLHTAKGAASALGLKALSVAIHDCESQLSLCRDDQLSNEFDISFTESHDKIQRCLQDYLDIYTKKIGKSLTPHLEISYHTADDIYDALKSFHPRPISILNSIAIPLDRFGKDLLNDRHRLAKNLGKPTPEVRISASGFINRATARAIELVFTHLLRNALDHGIEDPSMRTKEGKKAAGTLFINLREERDHYKIEFWDDGGGLDREKLSNLAKSKNHWPPQFESTAQDIVELIFIEGYSTAQELTDISGRGVGMGSIKQKVETMGGKLTIDIVNETQQRINFKVCLEIPLILEKSKELQVSV